jgi:AbrB family looped-hinge helix DNA binding protein
MQANLTMASNGRLVIPAPMRAEIGLQDGGKLVARVENGVVLLEPIDAAVRRARSLVRQYVPEGVSLVDELIAERHAAAAHE